MAKAPITKRTVDAAHPEKAEYVVWDDGGKETVKGFGLKVTPSGSKVYIYRYRLARPGEAANTPPRKYTIGKHGPLTPDQARDRAKELAAMVTRGIDPRQAELDAVAATAATRRQAEEKARAEGELAFSRYAARWLDHYENEKARRPASVKQAELVVRAYLAPALGDKPMPHITRADLQPILDRIPLRMKGMRRAVFAYASVLFGWAHKRGDIAENPLAAMAKPDAPKARERVLSDAEIAVVWNAAGQLREPLNAFYRVLLLTGKRLREVAGMNWAELDRTTATWVIPAARAKNSVDDIVPLSPAVVEELDKRSLARQARDGEEAPDAHRWPKAGPVMSFTGRVALTCYSQAKVFLDAEIAKEWTGAAPMAGWRVHDLRRTLATGLQRLGVRFEVTEAILNHVSGAKGGVAGIYQRHDWAAEKRAALDAWARHVAAIITPADGGNVVPISAAKQST